MNKIKKLARWGLPVLAALLLLVGAVSVRADWRGSLWELIADKTADRLAAKVELPDEVELGKKEFKQRFVNDHFHFVLL